MHVHINATQLRTTLPEVVARVRQGTRFTVVYRSKATFQIVPMGVATQAPETLGDDPVYKAGPLGRSVGGRKARGLDGLLYR